jgi:Fic family protein
MHSFERLDNHLGRLPHDILNAIGRIQEGRGNQNNLRQRYPMVLDKLQQVAMIQSVEASNAIEDIHVSHARLRKLALDNVAPEDRSEAEIAGYRRVLQEIHENGDNIPFSLNVVLQLHGWLFSYLPDLGGKFKFGENEVIEEHPDGTRVIRFKPVSAADTPRHMQELHERFDRAWANSGFHPLLLIATYVFDFLMVHPFQDGNGRMSRLITSLLLHRSDYDVGRYVSWEKKINDTRSVYYDALERSTRGWHEREHNLEPWLSYFLGVLVASYADLEERASIITAGHGARREIIAHFLRTSLSNRFRIEDIRQLLPPTSDVHIGRLLREFRDEGIIERRGAGRGTYWVRLRSDF